MQCRFQSLSLRYHPLRNPTNMALNAQRFAQICEAHDVLSNGKCRLGKSQISITFVFTDQSRRRRSMTSMASMVWRRAVLRLKERSMVVGTSSSKSLRVTSSVCLQTLSSYSSLALLTVAMFSRAFSATHSAVWQPLRPMNLRISASQSTARWKNSTVAQWSKPTSRERSSITTLSHCVQFHAVSKLRSSLVTPKALSLYSKRWVTSSLATRQPTSLLSSSKLSMRATVAPVTTWSTKRKSPCSTPSSAFLARSERLTVAQWPSLLTNKSALRHASWSWTRVCQSSAPMRRVISSSPSK